MNDVHLLKPLFSKVLDKCTNNVENQRFGATLVCPTVFRVQLAWRFTLCELFWVLVPRVRLPSIDGLGLKKLKKLVVDGLGLLDGTWGTSIVCSNNGFVGSPSSCKHKILVLVGFQTENFRMGRFAQLVAGFG